MSFRFVPISFALVIITAAPGPASAFGAPGCGNLPEYDRAVGTLQGLSTCDMSVEQARRIVAASQSGGGALAPLAHHRRQQDRAQ